jgi:hypothetical protein
MYQVAQHGEDRLPWLVTSFVAFLVVMTACMIRYLPQEFSIFIVSWTALSVSLGIAFGHGVLNEP